MTRRNPLVAIVLGSDSDLPHMEGAFKVLERFAIAYETRILSAHRSPEAVAAFATSAREAGIKVIIAAAGSAAHLAGALAARTVVPVIGVPVPALPLQGIDALLATVQMPAGVPVATVAIGAAGGTNAALLAAQILGLGDPQVTAKLVEYREELAAKVQARDRAVREAQRETG
ncbi:MAG: 5-(carboxyamino)imidazole ribonucleotide mutase [Planctomycetota bacterium]